MIDLIRCFVILICLSVFKVTGISQSNYSRIGIGKKSERLFGVLKETGQEIIPAKYDFVYRRGDFYMAKKNDKWGCFDTSGNSEIPIEYDGIGFKIESGLARVKRGKKWGFVDLENKTVIDFRFDFACNFRYGKAYVVIDNQACFIDSLGVIINNTDTVIERCPEDKIRVAEIGNQFEDSVLVITGKESKYGVRELMTMKIIIPEKYDEVGDYYNGIILVRKGKLWGAYKETGQLIAKPRYSYMTAFKDY